MTSKTTPTPTIRVCPLNSEVVEDANGEWFAETNDPARASLIVKAVNERESLLRALERLSVAAVSDPFATPPGELGWTTESVRAANKELDEAINQARALLSRARSEKP